MKAENLLHRIFKTVFLESLILLVPRESSVSKLNFHLQITLTSSLSNPLGNYKGNKNSSGFLVFERINLSVQVRTLDCSHEAS